MKAPTGSSRGATSATSHLRPRDVTGATRALAWRYIDDTDRAGALNMATDHVLAGSLADGEAVLRLYGWSRPTVSFGRNEPAADRYSLDKAVEEGIDFVRRPTGGRVVLHADELTYAVMAPARSLGGPRAAYRAVNEALAQALRSLGAPVGVLDQGRPLTLEAGPCFQIPTEGEVVAVGRKLVGSAQARLGHAILQHGSIIISGTQALLERIAVDGRREESPERQRAGRDPATLEQLLGPVHRTELREEVRRAMAVRFGGEWIDGELTDEERRERNRWVRERYGRDSWTWRR